jgi:hypothetical protein
MSRATRRSRSTIAGGTLALVLAAVATVAVRPTPVAARPTASTTSGSTRPTPSDRWLERVAGRKRRQLFDAPAAAGGIPLVHVFNYYETLNRAYRVADADIAGIGTFYGATTFYGLADAMWAKYRLGEFLETTDPATGKPAVGNPWRTSPIVLGMTLPQASIEALQRRGATFLLCNNALTIFAGLLAKARGLDADAVYTDLAAHILPGVELIPGMVVAIEQAHDADISYHRQ